MQRITAKRGRYALVVVVALVMVVSVLAFIGPSSLTAATRGVSPAITAPATVVSGPLKSVASASKLNPSGTTSMGQIDVSAVSSSYRSSAPITVTVNLAPTNSLANFVNEVGNPASPEYRHFLTASEVGEQFGVSPVNYRTVSNYFESYGLTVTPSSTLLELTVSGSVADMASAFHTQFQAFQESYLSNGAWLPRFGDQSGTPGSTTYGPVFYSNVAGASLPQSVDALVSGVAGLDGLYAVPNVILPNGLSPSTTPRAGSSAGFSATTNISNIQAISGANFTWADLTPTFYCEYENLCGNYQFLFPSTMHVLEGAEGLWDGADAVGGAPDQGQGITIALVEVGCVFPSDIAAFSQMVWGNTHELTSRVTQIALSGPTAIVPNNNLNNCTLNGEFWGWTGESNLDLEYAATMAPLAHIDVIGVPSADFSAFDSSYLTIAQYLATGRTCDLAGSGAVIVDGPATHACSVSIDSNSYGTSEQTQYFFGAPMYISVEDQDLAVLNAVGVTNLAASGDGGSFGAAASASIPAVSPYMTSVGGGQLTAYGPGEQEFPSGTTFCFGYLSTINGTNYCSNFNMTVASAEGVASFTYWSYGYGETGTFQGEAGGGFGASVSEPQPWWQNALDTYSTGSQISPVVSNTANFNMTFYLEGYWYIFYGGTSFACPITAGELALAEEQADLVLGAPQLGNVNPALFAAHNGYEAGVPVASENPYVPMTNIGVGATYAPENYYAGYLWNLSINEPSDPILPSWFNTLSNPAGPGWNLLQGLGMPVAWVLSNELMGGRTGPAGLLNPPFVALESSMGGLTSFESLTGGTAYTFDIQTTMGGTGGSYIVQAYSGGSNTGTYGGGTVKTIHASTGTFKYTPKYSTPLFPTGAPEYGYFVVTNAHDHSQVAFQEFAVLPAPSKGTLSLCVTDPYGSCDTGSAEVTMFTTVQTGYYNLYGSSTVELNGLPVANALVYQQVLYSQFQLADPTMPPSSYAPGAVIGHTLTDARGNGLFWTAPLGLAEVNGALATQIYVLWASYGGLESNAVVVFVEPQSGSYFTDLHLKGSTVHGTVEFADMKWINWLNISVGSGAGQYENESFPAGTSNGEVSVSLAAPPSGPVVVALVGEGQNNVGYEECYTEFGITYCFGETAVQSPMYWELALLLARGA